MELTTRFDLKKTATADLIADNINTYIPDSFDIIDTELGKATDHRTDYEYQTPTVVSRQIRLVKESDTNILKFKLNADLTGGAITISLDEGATDLPLLDVDDEPIEELDKGFVEVIKDVANFTLRPRGAKLDEIISAIEYWGGEVEEPKKLDDVVTAIDNVADWDEDLVAGNIAQGVTIFGRSGSITVPGIHWTAINSATPATADNLTAVGYGRGLWLVGDSEANVYSSPAQDNLSWTLRSSPANQWSINDFHYANGMFVMSYESPYNSVATSTDGITWTQRSISYQWNNMITFGVNYGNGLWVAMSSNGEYATSTNGTTWTRRTLGSQTANFCKPVYADGVWVTGSSGVGRIYTSTNGTSWTNRGDRGTGILAVGYVNGTFVAAGNTGEVFTSTDNGATWVSRGTQLGGNVWNFRESGGLLIAVCHQSLRSSKDGINWVVRHSSVSYRGIEVGDGFMASGGSNRIFHSRY